MKPILFSIGPLDIYAWGIFAALGFIIASFIIWRYGRDERLVEEKVLDSIMMVVGYAFVGARFLYMVMHFGEFSPNVLRFFLLWKFPGLSLVGGIALGLFGLLVASRKKKLVFWQLADYFMIGSTALISFGALGGLFDGSEIGIVTHLPIGIFFAGYPDRRHPIGLYEAVWGISLYVFLVILKQRMDRKRLPYGIVSLIGGLLWSVVFFALAFLKEEPVYLGGLSFNQVVFGLSSIIVPFVLYKRLGRILKHDGVLLLQKIRTMLPVKK